MFIYYFSHFALQMKLMTGSSKTHINQLHEFSTPQNQTKPIMEYVCILTTPMGPEDALVTLLSQPECGLWHPNTHTHTQCDDNSGTAGQVERKSNSRHDASPDWAGSKSFHGGLGTTFTTFTDCVRQTEQTVTSNKTASHYWQNSEPQVTEPVMGNVT